MEEGNLKHISTGEPTYWPSDRRRVPDVLDFCVTKGLTSNLFEVTSCLDLSSDHTPIIINMYAQTRNKQQQPSLYSRRTDWELFRAKLDSHIRLNIPLTSEYEIEESAELLTKAIQISAWEATPESNCTYNKNTCPIVVREMIIKKRHLRKKWQTYRTADNKRKFNKATRDLKALLYDLRNQETQSYLENLSATDASDYSL